MKQQLYTLSIAAILCFALIPIQGAHKSTQEYLLARTEKIKKSGADFCRQGKYKKGKECIEKVLKIYTKHYGEHDIRTAAIKVDLGNVLYKLGEYTEAKKHLKEALENHKQHYGANHIQTAATMAGFGHVFCQLGEYIKAKEHFENALPIYMGKYGEYHIKTADIMEDLGHSLYKVSNYVDAKKYLKKALKIKEKYFGKEHPKTASVIESLGVLYRSIEKFDKAKQCLGKVLHIYEKNYKENNIKRAAAEVNLANLLMDIGEYKESERSYSRALKTYENHYGKDHFETTSVIVSLGEVLAHLGRKEESEAEFKKALSRSMKCYGKDHLAAAKAQAAWGNVLSRKGAYKEAESFLRPALDTIDKHCRDNIKVILRINLGSVYVCQHLYSEAAECYSEGLNLLEDSQKLEKAELKRGLGDALLGLEKYEEARQYYTDTLIMYTKHYGENHVKTLSVKANIGETLRELERYKEAEDYFKKVLRNCHYGEYYLQEKSNINLASVLAAQGKYEEAEKHVTWVQALYEKNNITPQTNMLTAIKLETWGRVFAAKGARENANRYLEDSLRVKKRHYKRVLETYQEHYGENHTQTATMKSKLGDSFADLGLKQEAIKYYEEALNIFKRCTSEKKPLQIAKTIRYFVDLVIDLDAYAKAQEHLNDALRIYTKRSKEFMEANNPKATKKIELVIAKTRKSLTDVLKKQGKYTEAQKNVDSLLKIYTKYYGANHIKIANIKVELANMRIEQAFKGGSNTQYYEQAKRYLAQALPIIQQHYKESHPKRAQTMASWANVHKRLGSFKKAAQYFEQAIVLYTKRLDQAEGPTKARMIACKIAHIMEICGNMLITQATRKRKERDNAKSNYKQAKPSLPEASKSLCQDITSKKMRHYQQAKKAFRHAKAALKEVREVEKSAQEYLKKALRLYMQHGEMEDPRIARMMGNLGSFLVKIGRYAEAKPYLKKSLELKEDLYGKNDYKTVKTRVNFQQAILLEDNLRYHISFSDSLVYHEQRRCFMEVQLACEAQKRRLNARMIRETIDWAPNCLHHHIEYDRSYKKSNTPSKAPAFECEYEPPRQQLVGGYLQRGQIKEKGIKKVTIDAHHHVISFISRFVLFFLHPAEEQIWGGTLIRWWTGVETIKIVESVIQDYKEEAHAIHVTDKITREVTDHILTPIKSEIKNKNRALGTLADKTIVRYVRNVLFANLEEELTKPNQTWQQMLEATLPPHTINDVFTQLVEKTHRKNRRTIRALQYLIHTFEGITRFCIHGKLECVRDIIDGKVTYIPSSNSLTILHVLAVSSHPRYIQLEKELIEECVLAGADLHARDAHGNTPYQLSVSHAAPDNIQKQLQCE